MESLVNKAIRSIATQVAAGLGQAFTLESLPVEMAERVVRELQARNHLNDSTLQTVAGPHLTTLDLYNTFNDSSISSEAIEAALRREFSANRESAVQFPAGGHVFPSSYKASELNTRCPNLEVLILSRHHLNSEAVDLICQEPLCSHLRVLHLAGCHISTNAARRIVRHCTRLEDIDFSGNEEVCDDVFLPLASSDDVCCTSHYEVPEEVLEQFEGSAAQRKRKRHAMSPAAVIPEHRQRQSAVTCSSAPLQPETSALDVMLALPSPGTAKRAKRTDLLDDHSPRPSFTASFLVVSNIRYHLSSLNVSGCTRITNAGISAIAQLCPLLQDFDCSHCPRVDDIAPVVKFCRFLKHLDISDCPIDTNTVRWDSLIAGSLDGQVSVCLRHLESLKFSGSSLIEEGFSDWLRACSHSLRVLQLRNKVFADPNALTQFVMSAEVLEIVDLYGCAISSATLEAFTANAAVRGTLRQVNLCGIGEALDPFISSANFPRLNSLVIDGCLPVSIPLLRSALLRSPDLEFLSLQSISAGPLKQAQCAPLLLGLRNLKELEVWCMESVSMTFVGFVARLLPKLESLVLCAVGGDNTRSCLTIHELEAVRNSFPNLELNIWRHNVTGNRFHQHLPGRPRSPSSFTTNSRTVTNKLSITTDASPSGQLQTRVVVDDVPVWCLEHQVSLEHVVQTTTTNFGALPIVKCWCCNCNINDFAGVTFHSDANYVYWTVREPGPYAKYRFDKSQYNSTVALAVRQHAELVLSQQQAASDVADDAVSVATLDDLMDVVVM